MNFIKNIFLLFKTKKDSIKMIETTTEKTKDENKIDFTNSLKVHIVKEDKNKKIETPICPGDGLGIQTKISY